MPFLEGLLFSICSVGPSTMPQKLLLSPKGSRKLMEALWFQHGSIRALSPFIFGVAPGALLALARGHHPTLLFTILISHSVGTIESKKPHCLLCGDVVPGWFLDGSANTREPRTYKNHIACCAATWLLDGSWMVPGWLLA